MKYIIRDWSGLVLDFKKGALLPADFAVPMEFDTFDDAWAYIHENVEEAIWEDLMVVEKI